MVARQKNTPDHRWHQKRFHVKLTPDEVSRDYILEAGRYRLDKFIMDRGFFDAPNGARPAAAFKTPWDSAWHDETYQYKINGIRPVTAMSLGRDTFFHTE